MDMKCIQEGKLSELRDAVKWLFKMIAEVLASRMGCMEVTFTSRVISGRGAGAWTT